MSARSAHPRLPRLAADRCMQCSAALTPGLRRFVKQAKIPRNVRFSQHAPVIIDYDWTLSI